MQQSTQQSLRRLKHFAAVWDHNFRTEIVPLIKETESLMIALQILGKHDKLVQEKAEAFVHKIPYISLDPCIINHSELVRYCNPTSIKDANYAAIAKFGNHIWVVTDKPAKPLFRQALRGLLKDFVPVIATAATESVLRVAEEARATFRSLNAESASPTPDSPDSTLRPSKVGSPGSFEPQESKTVHLSGLATTETPEPVRLEVASTQDANPGNTVSTPPENKVEVPAVTVEVAKPRVFAGIPKEAQDQFETTFRKLNRGVVSDGREMLPMIISMAYTLGATDLHITPTDEITSGQADVTIRTPSGIVPIGQIRMANYSALSNILQTFHNMGEEDFFGSTTIKFSLERGNRISLESNCYAANLGKAANIRAFRLQLKSVGVITWASLFPDGDPEKLEELFQLFNQSGLHLVSTLSTAFRRDICSALTLPFQAKRLGTTGFTAGNSTSLLDPRTKEELQTLLELDMDALFLQEVSPDHLPLLTGYAKQTHLVAGWFMPSATTLFSAIDRSLMSQLGVVAFFSTEGVSYINGREVTSVAPTQGGDLPVHFIPFKR